jgi:hypothetical protein
MMNMTRVLLLVALCMVSIAAVAQNTFYIESRTAAGLLTDASLYEEGGSFWGDTTAKSSAPAPEIGGLKAPGARYSTNSTVDGTFTMKIGGHAEFVAGTAYNIYITAPNFPSTNAPQAPYVLYDNANPEGSPLSSGTVDMSQAAVGDVWLLVVGNQVLGAGAALKVSEYAGQPDRLVSDAVRIEPVGAAPTPTPTPTATPWPTPYTLLNEVVEVLDNANEDTAEFTINPKVTGGIYAAWFLSSETSGYNGSNYWFRNQRVESTVFEDNTATAVWTFQNVPAGTYTLGYFVPDTDTAFDNCYYTILCPETSLDVEVIVSQNELNEQWARLLPDLNLSGTVQVILDNRGRFGQSIGNQMFADAIGIFSNESPTAVRSENWLLYE